jgi:hypothetical protein
VVSDLFVSLVVKKPVYNISIPVMQDGTVRYVMSLGLRPEDLARTLDTLKLNQAWVTTIWDRDNAVLARSRDHDRFLGSKVPSTLRQRAMSQAVLKATNLDGEEVLLAVTTSKLSDWGISVNVPVAIAEAQLRSTLWLWGLASSWRTENGHEPSLLFEWREFGGPNVGPPSKPGLGTRLLQQAVPGAASTLLNETTGFVYRLRVSQTAVAGE